MRDDPRPPGHARPNVYAGYRHSSNAHQPRRASPLQERWAWRRRLRLHVTRVARGSRTRGAPGSSRPRWQQAPAPPAVGPWRLVNCAAPPSQPLTSLHGHAALAADAAGRKHPGALRSRRQGALASAHNAGTTKHVCVAESRRVPARRPPQRQQSLTSLVRVPCSWSASLRQLKR